MFHLFNRVYVETERLMTIAPAQINISAHTGFMKIEQPIGTISGEQVGYFQGIDSMSAEDFKDIFTKAVTYRDKLFIFCDPEAYVRLYSILLKALFPNIDEATFRFFFICRKAGFESYMVNYSNFFNDGHKAIEINREVVDRLYQTPEPMAEVLQEILLTYNPNLSLEWRIFKLIANGDVSDIPDTIKAMLSRAVVRTAQEAIAEWTRFITDDREWEWAGCDADTLLNAETCTKACLNFGTLNNDLFYTTSSLKARLSPALLQEVCKEAAEVLDKVGETAFAERTRIISTYLDPSFDINVPACCLDILKALFDNGVNTIRTTAEDSNKYDENIIRFALRRQPEEIRHYTDGVSW